VSESDKYTAVGVMSGTSLDGLDLALCEFEKKGEHYHYSILKSVTVPYLEKQQTKLKNASAQDAEHYFRLHHIYGKYIAGEINNFLKDSKQKPGIISSHGHTVFHRPSEGFTTQIGCGATIAALTGITTVCDLRSMDVALKGQGAPLVPLGDKLLFGNYESCLNLGGIANISFNHAGKNRVAFDICIANMALNFFANQLGMDYDKEGQVSSRGQLSESLFNKLNALPFYKKKGARSLGREQFETDILMLIEKESLSIQDNLCTLTHHIAYQVAEVLKQNGIKSVLVTGGGARNTFLTETLKSKFPGEVVIPDDVTVDFKEALIFAFLGMLRMKKEINTLRSVTGATSDSIGGAVYIGAGLIKK